MLITACVIVGLLLFLSLSSARISLVFLFAVAVLYVSGQVDQTVILGNITNSSVVTLLLLMVASQALERSHLLPWLSSKLLRTQYRWTLFNLAGVSVLSSAVLNNTAVVATLMGALTKGRDHPPSRLLIPLSYFAILGGTLTLIGTSTNLVVNGLIEEQGYPALGFFTFLPVGLALVVTCGATIFLISQRLPSNGYHAFSPEAFFLDAEVTADSKLIGKTVRQNKLRALEGLFLAEIVRGRRLISPVTPETVIEAGDKLIFTGNVCEVKQLSTFDGLVVFAEQDRLLNDNLVEVIVSPESVLINKTIKRVNFRSRFDAAVVAISRNGEALSGKLGEQVIATGDKLVLAAGADFHSRTNLSRNFFILNDKKIREPFSSWQNVVAVFGFACAVLGSVVSPLNLIDTLSLYILVCVMSGVIDGSSIRRRFPFELWMVLVSALTIAYAFSHSGLAAAITGWLFAGLGDSSVMLAYIGLFLITVVLTEAMTNSAAAAIMLPMALAFAQIYQVNYMPMVMAVTYAASASFISPYGYQTNLMVMNAGNYRFGDFIRAGWPVSLVYCVVALSAIPVFFPF
ncbi:potassium transporter TrkA [Photobacterium aquae]|uniref:Potassium transporter TrkA n=1 Tax=Photobacterium aquae TaxID=1195763 RepID=A0A0J1GWZ3_9GAMM|nr:SLC13 family permease [Photobacterium aquae]KLV03964.1 potassium transporter TrkA [Photobacterium aquae]